MEYDCIDDDAGKNKMEGRHWSEMPAVTPLPLVATTKEPCVFCFSLG